MSPTATDIVRIARNLRYTSVRPLIGLKVTLQSNLDVPQNLHAHIQKKLEYELEFKGPSAVERELALVKYSILDLTFLLNADVLDSTGGSNIDTLTDLGFDGNLTELGSLKSEIRKHKAYLRLFLKSTLMNDKERLTLRHLADDYFPHTFRIEDACITNAPSVWFFKHFYM